MYYVVDSDKSFEQASTDLEEQVKNHQFGVLHVHKMGEIFRSKGFDYKEELSIFEVCNPGQAYKVLDIDLQLNMALPCRISVYTENGQTKIGMIKPANLLQSLSNDDALMEIANEVEGLMTQMIDKTA